MDGDDFENDDIEDAMMALEFMGSSWQLLADPSLVDRLEGDVRLCLHQPIARDLIDAPMSDDGYSYRYMTVLQDGHVARMYYAMVRVDYSDGKRIKHPERICYAQSVDGVHWEKPAMDLIPLPAGTRDRNIIWMENGRDRLGISGFSPFRDENPQCNPGHRYKAITEAGPMAKQVLGRNGLMALGSPDGLRWSMLHPDLIMEGGPGISGYDSQNLAFWDSCHGEYRLYRRATFRQEQGAFRDILTATSKDFVHWTLPQRLSYQGATPDQLYTNNVIPYFRAPHLLVAFPTRYVQRPWCPAVEDLPERSRREWVIRNSGAEPTERAPTESGGQRSGTAVTDTQFMISRDGVNFHLWGEAFIRPGLRTRNNWFYGDNFQSWGMLTTASGMEGAPDELSFYVSEGSRRPEQGRLCRRYTMRLDGFVSAQAGRAGGTCLTNSIAVTGNRLQVNFSASAAGSVRVQLQDQEGLPLPGFSLDDGVELLGDDLERTVRWRSGANMASLSGRFVRIRFDLVDADLFAFRFSD